MFYPQNIFSSIIIPEKDPGQFEVWRHWNVTKWNKPKNNPTAEKRTWYGLCSTQFRIFQKSVLSFLKAFWMMHSQQFFFQEEKQIIILPKCFFKDWSYIFYNSLFEILIYIYVGSVNVSIFIPSLISWFVLVDFFINDSDFTALINNYILIIRFFII